MHALLKELSTSKAGFSLGSALAWVAKKNDDFFYPSLQLYPAKIVKDRSELSLTFTCITTDDTLFSQV